MIAVVVLLFSTPAPSHGFGEDVCHRYVVEGEQIVRKPFNCFDLQNPGPIPSTSPNKVKQGMLRCSLAVHEQYYTHAMIHFDVPWLLARINGIPENEAMQLATYAEGIDIGQFMPYDHQGMAMKQWKTEPLYHRINMEKNAYWLHYITWVRPEGYEGDISVLDYSVDASSSSPFPKQEVSINHVRSWAFGQRENLCIFGITDNSGDCYTEEDNVKVHVTLPYAGPITEQESILLTEYELGDNFDASDWKGSPAAMGIYIHALADRLSHRQCLDRSFMEKHSDEVIRTGPAGIISKNFEENDYKLVFSQACGTVNHMAHHYRESAHTPSPPRTRDAIRYMYRELKSWAEANGYENPPATQEVDEDMLVRQIVAAIELPEPSMRMVDLCRIGSSYGIAFYDGRPSCLPVDPATSVVDMLNVSEIHEPVSSGLPEGNDQINDAPTDANEISPRSSSSRVGR